MKWMRDALLIWVMVMVLTMMTVAVVLGTAYFFVKVC